jgi:hypothetical protein
MRFIRKAGAPADRSPKRLYVEPAELARKLVKEMDDHVLSRGEELWARNRYTIYLCPEDFQNLAPGASQLIADFKAKLAKHVADEEYLVAGDLIVEVVQDKELELGYFGILAQKGGAQPAAGQPVSEPGFVPEALPVEAAPAARAMPVPAPAAPASAAPARAADAARAAAAAAAAAAARGAAPALEAKDAAYTQVMPATEADELGLEGRVIVITTGDRVMQFRQNRVVIGRGKEADLRVNDPNVSRKHAAIYWNNGRLMVDDLGSTNGTMVNGYPVTRTMLRPTDVVAVGDSRLTAEGK